MTELSPLVLGLALIGPCFAFESANDPGTGSTDAGLTDADDTGTNDGGTELLPSCSTPSKFSSVSISSTHACGIGSDGQLYCWGNLNPAGISSSISPPVEFGLGKSWSQVAVGDLHSCAIDDAGELYCWGANIDGQLGLDPTVTSQVSEPTRASAGADNWQYVAVSSPPPAEGASAPNRRTCGIKTSGLVFCMGQVDGCGGDDHDWMPSQFNPSDSTQYTSLTMAGLHTCAITTTGELRCWGDNSGGQLGIDPVTTPSTSCPQILDGTWRSVSAAGGGTCGVQVNPDGPDPILCWGDGSHLPTNSSGDLGTALVATAYDPGLSASGHICALAEPTMSGAELGLPYCSGSNAFGQLGNELADDTFDDLVPVTWVGGDRTLGLAVGTHNSCAIDQENNLYCWGGNRYGQVGTGDNIPRSLPTLVCVE